MSATSSFDPLSLHHHLPEEIALQGYLVRGRFPREPASPAPSPPSIDEAVRTAVRKLLRWGGHKPSGRGRPASESLLKAVEDGRWPTITPLVDCCNLLSLRSGLPISVLDAGKLQAPLEIRVGRPEEEYVFNPSGQILSLKGLLLVADALGPTGGPVKDAQRSKVDENTEEHLILIWGSTLAPESSAMVSQELTAWCQQRDVPCQTLTFTKSLGE